MGQYTDVSHIAAPGRILRRAVSGAASKVTHMQDYDDYDDYPELDYLTAIEGFLVPIAHIKAIGWVEKTYPHPEEPYEGDQWYFRVHLDQPVGDQGDGVARDLAAFYPSEEEAEAARMRLAGRVNDFYKNQYVNSMFGGKLH